MAEPSLGAIDHVALVTGEPEAAEIIYAVMGLQVLHRERLSAEGIDVVLLGAVPPDEHGAARPIGEETAALAASGRLVELLVPFDQESGVARFLRERGPGMHHISFTVPDMASALDRCRAAGLQVIEPAPRRGILGRSVAFLHPRSAGGALIELVERPETPPH